MSRRIRRLSKLEASEWLLLLQLVPAASVIAIASRYARLERLVRVLTSARPFLAFPVLYGQLSELEVYRLSDLATRLTVGHRRCLQRSLLLHWLLSRHGVSPVLEVGVALRDGQLLSHAWVTVEGRPIGETNAMLTPFRTILRLGAA